MTESIEIYVRETAQHLPYPPTPDYRRRSVRSVPRMGLRYAASMLALVIVCSLAVPELRAAVLKILQIGQVTIMLDGTGAQGEALNLAAVAGEIGLAEAQAQASFPLLSSLDQPPDRVFLQDPELVIQVWLNEGQIERSLYQIGGFDWTVFKHSPNIVGVQVRDQPAFWIQLPHSVQFVRNGVLQTEMTHFVTGPVLIWENNGVTYRLESSTSLEDTLAFANALEVTP